MLAHSGGMKLHPAPFLALALASLNAHAATLPANEDTYSIRGKLTVATNKAATLPVDGTRRAFVFFNLAELPAGTQIRYARLRFYLPGVARAGAGLTVHQVTGPWDESFAGAEPAFNAAPLATFAPTALGAKRFVSVDVTATVQGWIAAPVSNEGFAFAAVPAASAKLTASVLIGSKEGSGSGYPAELEIELIPGQIGAALLAPDLNLAGTTTGIFDGVFVGNGAGLTGITAGSINGKIGTLQIANGAIGSLQLDSNLTLGGSTTGTFSGTFSGAFQLPTTSSANVGTITQNGISLIHTFGTNNFFGGSAAGNFTLTGSGNAAIGANALQSNTSGGSNTAIGWGALQNNTGGFSNVAIGHDALFNNTIGHDNIAIGLNAGHALTGDNNIAIGNSGVASESNTIRIGTSGTHAKTILVGNVGIGIAGPETPLHVAPTPTGRGMIIGVSGANGGFTSLNFDLSALSDGHARIQTIKAAGSAYGDIVLNGDGGNVGIGRVPLANKLEVEGTASKATATAWLSNSDRRIKTDVRPVTHALATLDRVRPVAFHYTAEYRKAHPGIEDREFLNVIAQEFAEVFPDAVKGSGERLADGSEILQVDTYPATITALAAIKELHAEVKAMREQNAALVRRVSELEAKEQRATGK